MRLLLLPVSLFLILNVVGAEKTGCTQITKAFKGSSDHPACRCFTTGMRPDTSGDTTWIGCTQKDLLDLHSALDSLENGTSVSKLWMWDCSLPVLIPALFNKVRPVTLKLESSTTRKWAPGVFDQLASRLKALELKHNHILELTKSSFAELKLLEKLDVSGNNISKLSSSSIGSLPQLTELFLQKNEIRMIADDTFIGLNNLKHLNIAHNKLVNITKSTFRGLDNLETLTLNDNHITYVHPDAFSHMTKLRSLNLGKNNLTELKLGSMPQLKELLLYRNRFTSIRKIQQSQPLRSLTLLSLDRNQIATVDELDLVHMPALNSLLLAFNNISRLYENALHPVKHLRTLSLQNNQLSDLHDGLFLPVMLLEHLLLSDNQLQQITERTLYGLRHLKVLVLTKNNISTFHRRALAAMFSLERLYINQNKMTKLENGTLMYIDASIRSIDLSDNPWNCDCELSWLPTWLLRHSKISVNLDRTACHQSTVQLPKASHSELSPMLSSEELLRKACSNDPSQSGSDSDGTDNGHATWITAIAIVLAVVSLLILAAIAVLYMQELRRGYGGVEFWALNLDKNYLRRAPSDMVNLIQGNKSSVNGGHSNGEWDKKTTTTTVTVDEQSTTAQPIAGVHEKKRVRFQTPSTGNLVQT